MFVWLHELCGQIQYYVYANKNDIELLKIFIKCIVQSELRPDARVNIGNWGRAWLRVCSTLQAAMMDGQSNGVGRPWGRGGGIELTKVACKR